MTTNEIMACIIAALMLQLLHYSSNNTAVSPPPPPPSSAASASEQYVEPSRIIIITCIIIVIARLDADAVLHSIKYCTPKDRTHLEALRARKKVTRLLFRNGQNITFSFRLVASKKSSL